jgi:hypothetical protein
MACTAPTGSESAGRRLPPDVLATRQMLAYALRYDSAPEAPRLSLRDLSSGNSRNTSEFDGKERAVTRRFSTPEQPRGSPSEEASVHSSRRAVSSLWPDARPASRGRATRIVDGNLLIGMSTCFNHLATAFGLPTGSQIHKKTPTTA